MLRMIIILIMLVSLLTGSLHAGHDLVGGDAHQAEGCLLSSACGTPDQTSHDQGNHHSDHCCASHTHQLAISNQATCFIPPSLEKQYTAVIPHFFPAEYSQERFIPPRQTV